MTKNIQNNTPMIPYAFNPMKREANTATGFNPNEEDTNLGSIICRIIETTT